MLDAFRTGRAAAVLLPLAFAACDDPQAIGPHDHPAAVFAQVSAGELDGIARELRQVTARFNSIQQAAHAGYAEASPCVAVPGLGAMGHHWVAMDRVDPVFDPLNPEALLYVPDHNGQLRLVGVEYIVVDVGQPEPSFAGHPFDIGGAPLPVDHWTLHAWVHERNPAGFHAPFNPAVACP